MNWRDLVQSDGQSAEKVHACVLVVITDCIGQDDTYHLLIGGYELRARTAHGVDLTLAEFTVSDGGFCVRREVVR